MDERALIKVALKTEQRQKSEEIDDDAILRRINVLYRDASLSQVLGEWMRLKGEEEAWILRIEAKIAASGC